MMELVRTLRCCFGAAATGSALVSACGRVVRKSLDNELADEIGGSLRRPHPLSFRLPTARPSSMGTYGNYGAHDREVFIPFSHGRRRLRACLALQISDELAQRG